MTRGVSPQASVVDRPTASSRRQISGTSSIADPVVLDVLPVGDVGGVAGELVEISPMTRSCSVVSGPPSMRTRSMKYLSSSSSGSSEPVLPPSIPGLRWV